MQILSNFYDTLKEFLTEKEMTPRMFAKQAGFPESAVYYWLDRTYVPSTANLLRFADFCDVSLDYLLGLSEPRSFRRPAQPVPFAERFRTLLQQTGKSQYAAIPFKEPPPFSEQIRFLLQHFGISEYALHKNAEISRSLLHSWKKGMTCPSVPNLVKLAALFGCSVDFVIGRES